MLPGVSAPDIPEGQAPKKDPYMRQLLDETGTPILYAGGVTSGQDHGYIKFPGGRWLRFPVRGTKRAHAIMSAVDQAGNKVARYRLVSNKPSFWKQCHLAWVDLSVCLRFPAGAGMITACGSN